MSSWPPLQSTVTRDVDRARPSAGRRTFPLNGSSVPDRRIMASRTTAHHQGTQSETTRPLRLMSEKSVLSPATRLAVIVTTSSVPRSVSYCLIWMYYHVFYFCYCCISASFSSPHAAIWHKVGRWWTMESEWTFNVQFFLTAAPINVFKFWNSARASR